jgi:hypothetical protein
VLIRGTHKRKRPQEAIKTKKRKDKRKWGRIQEVRKTRRRKDNEAGKMEEVKTQGGSKTEGNGGKRKDTRRRKERRKLGK